MIIKKFDNPIILVDGSSYIYRAYYAFPFLTSSKGDPVWVIYGVINMIRSLLKRYQPTDMVVVFDSVGKTFRDDLFQKYKSNRTQMPESFYIQISPLYEMIKAIGIPILSIPYVEADDVIGTLAIFYEKLGKTVLISTIDKDMAQIVSSKIILINTTSNIIYDSENIKKKFGVIPNLIADYLALVGDRSDGIPGVPSIGKKIAKVLLNEIGNLKTLYQNLNNISNVGIRRFQLVQNALVSHKEIALLSYKLATIKLDVPLQKLDYILSIREINVQDLWLLFKKYEFDNWAKELKLGIWLHSCKYRYSERISLNQNTEQVYFSLNKEEKSHICLKSKKNINCIIVSHINILCDWIKKISKFDLLIFDIYTDKSDCFTNQIIGVCLSVCTVCKQENIYIPITHDSSNENNKNCLNFKEVLLMLKPVMENVKIKKIGQNMKFNHALLRHYNIDLLGITFDVVLEFYILYSTSNYQNVKRFLDINVFNAIVNFRKDYDNYYNSFSTENFRNIKSESLCSGKLMYSILHLHQILWAVIQSNDKLKKIFEDIEIPLISILSRIEGYGVLIDRDLLNNHLIDLNYRLCELKKEAYQLVDIPFNLASTKQLQKILYDEQKLPILKKTPTGFPSTSEEVLKKLSKKYLIPQIILKYRALSKLKSTYINKLLSMVNEKSSRVHTSYNQTRTTTGRLSSANPNLQNIPNRNYDGRKIRQAFIAPSNFLIVSADYSQIELRIMAHLSHDLKLINDFRSGKDIHTTTASEIFVTKLHLVTSEQRHQAKTINFGLIYGMSAFGLARQLSVTCKEAQKYVDRYFQRYPGVMQYMQYIKTNVSKYGYVLTLDGRRLYLPDIYSDNVSQKKSAERAAINAPMQGSAADIIKKAMISIDYWLQSDNIPARMIMQVHDELVFEVQNNFIDIVVKQIKKLMEECFVLDVPLKVDIGVGKNWEQAH